MILEYDPLGTRLAQPEKNKTLHPVAKWPLLKPGGEAERQPSRILWRWIIGLFMIIVVLISITIWLKRPYLPDGQIVYIKFIGKELVPFVMNSDGSNIIRLTPSGNFTWPAWSPNGKTIAVGCGDDHGSNICIIDMLRLPDMRSVPLLQAWRFPSIEQRIPLAESCSSISSITWASDGKRLAYVCPQYPQDDQVCVSNLDGKANCWQTSALKEEGGRIGVSRISWSPTSERLAVSVNELGPGGPETRTNLTASEMMGKDNENRIYLVDPDGQNRKLLTTGWNMDWSKDGRMFVFFKFDRQMGTVKISTIDADGSQLHDIYRPPVSLLEEGVSSILIEQKDLFFPGMDSTVTWSPDGHFITFAAMRNADDVNSGIFLMNLNTKEIISLTAYGDGEFYYPDWSP
jgi:Tol biopolymer transport system component